MLVFIRRQPSILIGLALVRGPNFTLPLHGNFLALLAKQDCSMHMLIHFSQPSKEGWPF